MTRKCASSAVRSGIFPEIEEVQGIAMWRCKTGGSFRAFIRLAAALVHHR